MDRYLQNIYDSVPRAIDGYVVEIPLAFGHCPATYQPYDFLIARACPEDRLPQGSAPARQYILFSRRTGNVGYRDAHGDGLWHVERPLVSRSTLTGKPLVDLVETLARAEAYGGSDNGYGAYHVVWAGADKIRSENEKENEKKGTRMNEHGVPYHGYSLSLSDGGEVLMDVGNKEDYARVVKATTRAGKPSVLWYCGKHAAVEITDVFDCESEDHLTPSAWFEDEIRPLFRHYYPGDAE